MPWAWTIETVHLRGLPNQHMLAVLTRRWITFPARCSTRKWCHEWNQTKNGAVDGDIPADAKRMWQASRGQRAKHQIGRAAAEAKDVRDISWHPNQNMARAAQQIIGRD